MAASPTVSVRWEVNNGNQPNCPEHLDCSNTCIGAFSQQRDANNCVTGCRCDKVRCPEINCLQICRNLDFLERTDPVTGCKGCNCHPVNPVCSSQINCDLMCFGQDYKVERDNQGCVVGCECFL